MSTTGIGGLISSMHGSWSAVLGGDGRTLRKVVSMPGRSSKPTREGVFAPVVVLVRNIIGPKTFNKLRGKAIALHSQVITEFCKTIGADGKQRQGLIRLAKKNGEKLGFLA
ncbi:hypothetical protein HPP92_008537 [Vanilla planifolia]|uniref:Proton gradient regulation 5 n=1 Tax=Vanilla planifolia TaxID=51239 RepID=A0A835RDI2_VANPL|nr:hypothetical protein HPP92_008537 [Vanilla planifolia]